MTNPYQRGTGPGGAAFPPDPLNFGQQRRTSYASAAGTGTAGYIGRPAGSGFSHLLNPAYPGESGFDAAALSYPPSRSGHDAAATDHASTRNGAPVQNGAPWNGNVNRYSTLSRQLPQHSRAFEPFSRSALYDGFGMQMSGQVKAQLLRHFVPSYLRGSAYAQRLEDAHRAKVAALRDNANSSTSTSAGLMQSQVGGGGLGGGGGGGVNNGSSGFRGVVGIHSAHHNQVYGDHHHHVHNAAAAVKLGTGGAPTSHRGLAFDVVEKPPSALDEEDAVTPLPTRWNQGDKCSNLEVLADGLEVKYSTPRNPSERPERDHEACAIRADQPMPPECGIYYFEVTILSSKRDETMIGIGFCAKHVALSRAPGWEPDSWGYHGDDGRCFASQTNGKEYGPPYGVGDVIGCGVNFRTGEAFFTKNGQQLKMPAFRDVKGQLYPSVGLKKTGNHVRVNFGQTPFQFAIDSMMDRERQIVQVEIEATSTRGLEPSLDESSLIQKLVLQFLQHDGYIETARAFADEISDQKRALTLDPNEVVESSSIKDDEDANNRQRIRRAILEGDIDRALKYTNAYYPQVLRDNEHVNFRLKSRKFIEMIRREAERKLVAGDGGSDKRASNGLGSLHQQHQSQDMDVDLAGTASSSVWDSMETEDAPGGALEAILYGQSLQAEYKNDLRREVKQTLHEMFGLMAYTNPLKEKEVAHLLDRKGRVAVAEELNSAILLSLGKSERSALENLWAQTTVLLEDIQQDGGPGAFVAIQDLVDSISDEQSRSSW